MYNNLPGGNNLNPAATAFNSTYGQPLELDPNTFSMMKGFFESKGFDKTSAETIAVTFIKQARTDGYNPMEVLDTMKGLPVPELNTVVTEILNFNRYKTSYLGKNQTGSSFEPVSRNIAI